jgi:hypothetical protein
VKTLGIARGSPWENGDTASFNGKLRDEFTASIWSLASVPGAGGTDVVSTGTVFMASGDPILSDVQLVLGGADSGSCPTLLIDDADFD